MTQVVVGIAEALNANPTRHVADAARLFFAFAKPPVEPKIRSEFTLYLPLADMVTEPEPPDVVDVHFRSSWAVL